MEHVIIHWLWWFNKKVCHSGTQNFCAKNGDFSQKRPPGANPAVCGKGGNSLVGTGNFDGCLGGCGGQRFFLEALLIAADGGADQVLAVDHGAFR